MFFSLLYCFINIRLEYTSFKRRVHLILVSLGIVVINNNDRSNTCTRKLFFSFASIFKVPPTEQTQIHRQHITPYLTCHIRPISQL